MAFTDVPRDSVTVNVRKAVFAPLTDDGQAQYGDVRPICKDGLMSVKASTKTESESVYGDGGLRDVSSDMGASSVEMEINSLSTEDDALMHGHKYDKTKKSMLVKSSDIVPYIATGFAIEKFDGSVNAYWYFKGKAEEVDVNVKQKEGKTNFSTPSVTINFVDAKDSERFLKKEFDKFDAAKAWLEAGPKKALDDNNAAGGIGG